MASDLLAPDTSTVYSTARDRQAASTLPANQQEALAALLAGLRAEYADAIERLYLYGSGARGDGQADADVDLLVVLSQPATWTMSERIRAAAADVSAAFDCDLHLLLFDPIAMTWHGQGSSLWMNVQQEGVDLWHDADEGGVDVRLPRAVVREELPVILTPAQRDEIRIHMAHAHEDLEIAATLSDSGHHRVAIARCYYAAFYAISALLLTEGVVRTKHGAVRAAVHRYLVRPGVLTAAQGKLFDRLQHERQDADYDMLYAPGEEIAEERLEQSRMLVAVARIHLENRGYL